jgi:hypothetical protein
MVDEISLSALAYMEKVQSHAASWKKLREEIEIDKALLQSIVSLQTLDGIVSLFSCTWFVLAKWRLYDLATAAIETKVGELKKSTPAWNQLITAKRYNANLAKKMLLNTDMQEKLTRLIEETFYLVASLAAAYEKFGDNELGDKSLVVNEAETALDSAREAMTVCAAVSLVEVLQKSLSHDEKVKKAKGLLATKSLPESLRLKVQTIAETRA